MHPNMSQIFIDGDGQLADFDQHFFNVFNKHRTECEFLESWRLITNSEKWWQAKPRILLKDGQQLWEAIQHLKPVNVTSSYRPAKWILKNPGDIMIDNREEHI